MSWAPGPYPQRFDVPEFDLAFVPLTPALLDDDYVAVMRDIAMLRRWSGQDWPTPTFTKEESLVDLERHHHEQQDGVALTYSLLVHGAVQGCIYVRLLADALSTRDIEPTTDPMVPSTDAVVRGWAHDIDAAVLITSARLFLSRAGLHITRLWWQTNDACPDQLAACDASGLTDALEFETAERTWVLRAAPVVAPSPVVPA